MERLNICSSIGIGELRQFVGDCLLLDKISRNDIDTSARPGRCDYGGNRPPIKKLSLPPFPTRYEFINEGETYKKGTLSALLSVDSCMEVLDLKG